jgi:hypothetical protein
VRKKKKEKEKEIESRDVTFSPSAQCCSREQDRSTDSKFWLDFKKSAAEKKID